MRPPAPHHSSGYTTYRVSTPVMKINKPEETHAAYFIVPIPQPMKDYLHCSRFLSKP